MTGMARSRRRSWRRPRQLREAGACCTTSEVRRIARIWGREGGGADDDKNGVFGVSHGATTTDKKSGETRMDQIYCCNVSSIIE